MLNLLSYKSYKPFTQKNHNPKINGFVVIDLKNDITKINKAIKVFKYLIL